MRKLIEKSKQSELVCDNPECDYKMQYDPNNELQTIFYIDTPCPICGENLLTIEDYLQYEKLMKTVDWINKWFSWLTIFTSKNAKKQIVSAHVHDGIKFKNEK